MNTPTSSTPTAPSCAPSTRGDDRLDGRLFGRAALGALAALAVSIPHGLGIGLMAYGSFGSLEQAQALALWSSAIPGAMLMLLCRVRGVVYAPSAGAAIVLGSMLALVMQSGADVGISFAQGLAITSAFMALAFLLQWLMGRSGLTVAARFLPVPVLQGFAAGIGLSLMAFTLRSLWQRYSAAPPSVAAWQVGLLLATVAVSVGFQRRWPRMPGILAGIVSVGLAAWLLMPAEAFSPAGVAHAPSGWGLPDWAQAPWRHVLQRSGAQLATLALLLALVNGLDTLIYQQELDGQPGVPGRAGQRLMRESLVSAAVALLGLIPASTAASRSRTAAQYVTPPTLTVSALHAGAMLLVAVTGSLWLDQVAWPCLLGGLLFAAVRMIPAPMSAALRLAPRHVPRAALVAWGVALVFVIAGGVVALVTGLAAATVLLLKASSTHCIRRVHLGGPLRSRHVRPHDAEAWLATRRTQIAVFELQGIVSFGVAAMLVDRVPQALTEQRWVIIDAARVPDWDETGCDRMLQLADTLRARGVTLLLNSPRGLARTALARLPQFDTRERALGWIEDQMLADAPGARSQHPDSAAPPFDELTHGLPAADLAALSRGIAEHRHAPGAPIFKLGDRSRQLLCVRAGEVTLSTADAPGQGLRLAVVGPGRVFGEVAFLNGVPRTAHALAGEHGAVLATLEWDTYQRWARAHPDSAAQFMAALARVGLQRLEVTTADLRAALEEDRM